MTGRPVPPIFTCAVSPSRASTRTAWVWPVVMGLIAISREIVTSPGITRSKTNWPVASQVAWPLHQGSVPGVSPGRSYARLTDSPLPGRLPMRTVPATRPHGRTVSVSPVEFDFLSEKCLAKPRSCNTTIVKGGS